MSSLYNKYEEAKRCLFDMAIDIINNYSGSRLVTLGTGEKAIDNDDSYIVITPEGPKLRDKRSDNDRNDKDISSIPMRKTSEVEDILALADSLLN